MRQFWNPETGEWQSTRPVRKSRVMHGVMPDIQSFVNIIDGQEITSRSQKREMMRRFNVEEVGNERVQRREVRPEGVAQSISDAWDRITAGTHRD